MVISMRRCNRPFDPVVSSDAHGRAGASGRGPRAIQREARSRATEGRRSRARWLMYGAGASSVSRLDARGTPMLVLIPAALDAAGVRHLSKVLHDH